MIAPAPALNLTIRVDSDGQPVIAVSLGDHDEVVPVLVTPRLACFAEAMNEFAAARLGNPAADHDDERQRVQAMSEMPRVRG